MKTIDSCMDSNMIYVCLLKLDLVCNVTEMRKIQYMKYEMTDKIRRKDDLVICFDINENLN